MNNKVRVLIVDDSLFYQKRITEMFRTEPAIDVIGVAGDGLSALAEVHRLRPDVVTMDVNMPVMDGISAVKRIMAEVPTPVLMFSALTYEGARATLDALESGAMDFLPKQFNGRSSGPEMTRILVQRILTLAHKGQLQGHVESAAETFPQPAPVLRKDALRLIAIGASTGGPVAIRQLLSALPANFSLPILLVVHMPASFTHAYAERLDSQCRIHVKEAEDGDLLRPGFAYLAPGGRQMLLEKSAQSARISIKESTTGQTYKPSVDVTLGSAARYYPDGVLAIILTGMGADGRQAARLLKQGGSTVWTQDEASCVVYGMPHAVESAGLSDRSLPLNEIGPSLVQMV